MTETIHQRNVAYLVKAWPRLSETFVLNEIISLEQRGLRIRIFSVRDPDAGPSNSKVSQVRAEVTYLAFGTHWKQVVPANLRLFCRRPGRYLRVLLQAITMMVIRRHRFAPPWHFFEAAYLVEMLSRSPADHLHAHFASTPALIALYAPTKDFFPSNTDRCAMEKYAAFITDSTSRNLISGRPQKWSPARQ